MPPTPSLAIGRTLSTGFAVLGRNLVPFVVLAVLFHLPWIALGFAEPAFAGGSGSEAARDTSANDRVTALLLGFLLQQLLQFALAGALGYAVVQYLRGQPAGTGASIRQGLASLPRTLGTLFGVGLWMLLPMLLAGIGVFVLAMFMTGGRPREPYLAALLGILAMTPGLLLAFVLMVRMWLAVPATVMEGVTFLRACRRSADLTAGNRWRIVAVILLVGIAAWMLHAGLGILTFGASEPVQMGTNMALTVVTSAVGALFPAVGYWQIRSARENVDQEQLARVFG